jgi:hypothetical protein
LANGAVLDFSQVLPADLTYVTFEGSLTTPPCTEGILWHVLTNPLVITLQQVTSDILTAGNLHSNRLVGIVYSLQRQAAQGDNFQECGVFQAFIRVAILLITIRIFSSVPGQY